MWLRGSWDGATNQSASSRRARPVFKKPGSVRDPAWPWEKHFQQQTKGRKTALFIP